MKQLLITLTLALCTFNAPAQNPYKKKTLEERAAQFTKEITDYIPSIQGATKDSLLEVNIVVTKMFDSLKALKLESDAYKPAAKGIFKQRDEMVKKVLDAKQYDYYLMLQAEKYEEYKKRKAEQEKNK